MSSTSALLNFSASAGEARQGAGGRHPARRERARARPRRVTRNSWTASTPTSSSSLPPRRRAWTPSAPRAFVSPKATARLDASARRHAAPGDAIAREPEPSAKDARRTREGDAAAGGARLPVPLTGEARVLREPRPRRIRARCPRQPDCSHYLTPSRVLRARARLTPRNRLRVSARSGMLLQVEPFALAVRGVHPLGRPARVPRLHAGQGFAPCRRFRDAAIARRRERLVNANAHVEKQARLTDSFQC